MAENPQNPYVPPQVTNHAAKPAGILPKNAQTWMICALALVMVLVIALSGGNPPKRVGSSPVTASIVDPNDARIRELRARIEQQTQKLIEQNRAQQAMPVLETPAGRSGSSVGSRDVYGSRSSRLTMDTDPDGSFPVPAREKNWIELDREKREYESRYASNVALSRRKEAGTTAAPRTGATTAGEEPGGSLKAASSADAELRTAVGKNYRVFEGTVIETVLTNRLDGTFSGPVNCLVTTNLYSHDHTKLLIPQGTRVLGDVDRVDALGQQRLAVKFHRLVMPDGFSVHLDKLPGLSAPGETGLVDQVNHHYLQVFGVSIAIGAIAGLSQANTQYGSYGASAPAEDVYRQGVATSLSQSSLSILNRYLNVLPTFTIREGHRIKVYLTSDLTLPAYDNHRLNRDL